MPNERDADFSRRIGLTPQVISNYRNRVNGASLEAVVTVCKTAGIDANWLLTGEGHHRRITGERNEIAARVNAAAKLIEQALQALQMDDLHPDGRDARNGEE